MKIGVLTDVHGDIFALDAALGRLHGMGCDVILCAGDLIDMEPFGEEVVRRLKAEKDLICILGNHERWALDRRHRQKDMRSFFEPCHISEYFGGGAELSRESLVWLATLPVHWEAELEGVRVAMWHARPGSDMEGLEKERTGPELRHRLLEQAHAQILIVGHTHVEFELVVNVPPGKILNPGACCGKAYIYRETGPLMVPDEFRPATFGVLELPSMRFKVFRALDGERVFGTSPDRPCMRT
ncbi:MAG: metallophosphoesterase family protein [Polyangia bacterium]|jgi:predicted phosphodiesterase